LAKGGDDFGGWAVRTPAVGILENVMLPLILLLGERSILNKQLNKHMWFL
jgi:hypothetical protein